MARLFKGRLISEHHCNQEFIIYGKGAFNNYVDRILPFFDPVPPPPPCVDSFYILSVAKTENFDPPFLST